MDQSVFLRQRDELIGIDQPDPRQIQPHQGFRRVIDLFSHMVDRLTVYQHTRIIQSSFLRDILQLTQDHLLLLKPFLILFRHMIISI